MRKVIPSRARLLTPLGGFVPREESGAKAPPSKRQFRRCCGSFCCCQQPADGTLAMPALSGGYMKPRPKRIRKMRGLALIQASVIIVVDTVMRVQDDS